MWKYYQPVEIIFGNKEIENIGIYMEKNGMDKALVVAMPVLVQNGLINRVIEASNGKIISVVSDVEPNPTIQNVDFCAAEARKIGAECIIAIGGGSVIDCAKSAAVAVTDGCSAKELLNGHEIKSALPIIAVPTTSGTSSELTAGAVISDKEKGIKSAIFSPAIFPKLAIIDPELTYSCPPSVTASSGIDVLAHALDSLGSVKSNFVTESLAVKAAKLVFENLKDAVKDGSNKEAREKMSLATVLAGLAFSQTGTTGSHACSYILTSKYNVPHGEACAFTLDSWYLINTQSRPKLNDYAKEMGFNNSEEIVDAINDLKKTFNMKTTLLDVGIKEEDLIEVVKSCMASGNMTNNIAQIGSEGILTIFRSKK